MMTSPTSLWKKKKKGKKNLPTCYETLIYPSAVRTKRPCTHPHPARPLCGTTRGFYRRQASLMNIHAADAAGDATEFAEISAEKSPSREATRVRPCCTVCMRRGGGGVALQFPVLLWHTTCPRTSKCWNTCIHTHTRWHPPTCFYVYTVWLVNTGNCVLTCFFFLFLVRKVICSASSRNRSASARRLMTQTWSWIICE